VSWFNPRPKRSPIRRPRRIPKVVVPSFIGEPNQVLNMLTNYTKGGTHVHDHSSEKNHGIMRNFADPYGWVDGQFGWAIYLDGSDDFIEVPDDASLRFGSAGDFTLEAWVRTGVEAVQDLMTKADGAAPFYRMHLTSGGDLRAGVNDGTNVAFASGGYVSDDAWHHVMFTADRDGNGITYLDGSSTDTVDISAVGDIDQAVPLTIGAFSTVPDYPLDGYMALPRIYAEVKTAEFAERSFERTRGIFGV